VRVWVFLTGIGVDCEFGWFAFVLVDHLVAVTHDRLFQGWCLVSHHGQEMLDVGPHRFVFLPLKLDLFHITDIAALTDEADPLLVVRWCADFFDPNVDLAQEDLVLADPILTRAFSVEP
jgi:hypothetical protein